MSRTGRRVGLLLLALSGLYLLILYKYDESLPKPDLNSLHTHSPLSERTHSSPITVKYTTTKTTRVHPEKPEVSSARRRVQKELKSFPLDQINLGDDLPLSWSDLLMEKGGQPIRALILTTWRSGSTFMGDILKSHPSAFYHYEPLLHYGIRQVRESNPKLALDALRVIKSLLNCSYDALDDYITYGKSHNWLFTHNERLWDHCRNGQNQACWDPKILGEICALHPFQTLKTVRLRLSLARSLLDDKSLKHTKILHIVRDPRGTLQSRKHRDWCPGEPDCDQPKSLCSDLVSDYHASKELLRDYPERFIVFRYEDFSKDPYSNSRVVLDFFNFVYTESVQKFLQTHTGQNKGGVSSTFRDSNKAPYHWIKDLTKEEILWIQGGCVEAMRLWGYLPMSPDFDKASLDFQPLGNFSIIPENE